MKTMLRRAAALTLVLGVLTSSALALTPSQLGDILKERYVGDIPAGVWQETTVEGMLNALGDPFTHYYTAQEYAAFLAQLSETGVSGATASVKLEDGVGWVELRAFGSDTYEILKQGVTDYDDAADRWIVDLRGNRGGELQATLDAASVFTGGGQLAYLMEKGDKLYTAKAEEAALTLDPVLVLVGSGTASGGELFAAAIRDTGAGLVIGSRTYGKGAGQTPFTKAEYPAAFADGSALLLTTSKLYSAGGVTNNIMGVLPYLMVEDAYAARVAKLLSASSPVGGSAGYLRIHLGWRWYVREADAKADPEAFRALLEALPPNTGLYLGGASWSEVAPADIAARWGVEYSPRAFSDVAQSPYADAINALKTYGIVRGDHTGAFDPTNTITRGQVCSLLVQAMGYPKTPGQSVFTDVAEDAWYTPYVNTMSAMGIVNGMGDGTFDPDGSITQQDYMTILGRIARYTSFQCAGAMSAGMDEESAASGDYDAYGSWARTAAWALDGAWYAPAKDIQPRAAILREEAARDLWGMLTVMGIIPG